MLQITIELSLKSKLRPVVGFKPNLYCAFRYSVGCSVKILIFNIGLKLSQLFFQMVMTRWQFFMFSVMAAGFKTNF